MSHVVRASVALAVACARAYRPAPPPPRRRSRSTRHGRARSTALPTKTPKNLSRKCGKSKSAIKIRVRRTSRPTKNRVRTVTTYCNGGTRTRLHDQARRRSPRSSRSRSGHAASRRAPAPAPKAFRLTLLHNNDGESKYIVGDSIANYGGITRFKTVLDSLRARGRRHPTSPRRHRDKGTVTISSGDNFLAGLNLRASFQRFDAGAGPVLRLRRDRRDRLRRDHDRQPRVRLRPDAPRAVHRRRAQRRAVHHGQHGLQRRADRCRRCATTGRIADSVVVNKGGEKIGIIGVSPPETPTHLLAAQRQVQRRRRGHRQRRGRSALDRRGREQDHPVLASAGHGQREARSCKLHERRHRDLRRRRRAAGQPERPARARSPARPAVGPYPR